MKKYKDTIGRLPKMHTYEEVLARIYPTKEAREAYEKEALKYILELKRKKQRLAKQ